MKLLALLIASGLCVFLGCADSRWETSPNNDGSYSRLKMINGAVDEEIGYTKDGRKRSHRYQDSKFRTHVVTFDPDSGVETEHDVIE